jgi:hypothetical protein
MARYTDEESESEIVPGFGVMTLTPSTSSDSTNKRLPLLQQWNNYFQKGTLEDFQRLCADLDLASDLPSKTKCREVGPMTPISHKSMLT